MMSPRLTGAFHSSSSSFFRNSHTLSRAFRGKGIFSTTTIGVSIAAALVALNSQEKNNAQACGIVGIVGQSPVAKDYLLEGLTILQNRGYDSAGIATINHEAEPMVAISKFASVSGTADSINLLKNNVELHDDARIGIAHTRWATHGGKTDANSHPHLDQSGVVAVVHNGTITNYMELKNELTEQHGVHFRSETDSEVISQLIGIYHIKKGMNLLDATKEALTRLDGTWGVCVMSKNEPDQIVAARNGSPMVIGFGSDRMFIASETTAFNRYTKNFIALQDGEVVVVKATGAELCQTGEKDDDKLISERMQKAPEQKVKLDPAPYPHWTIREIMEQPKAIASSLGYGGRISEDSVQLGGLDNNSKMLLGIDDLLISACGTSLFASMYGERLFRSLGCFHTIQCVDAAEASNDNVPKPNGGLLVVSQSGETKDVHRLLKSASGVPQFSIVNAVGSLIARSTGCGVYCQAGRENAVASTKAFVTQVTVFGLIASWFAKNKQSCKEGVVQDLMNAMHRLPITCGMALQTRDQCKEIAAKLLNKKHLFVLGKGFAEPIAHEGALKIKEITYLHAEGYSGGALKHGPFALIDPEDRTPIIMIILDDEHSALMCTAAEEVKARGAHVIVITDRPSMVKNVADDIIKIPKNGPLTALLAVCPLQLIAYELAVMKGINPDVPRNLAKAVTVD